MKTLGLVQGIPLGIRPLSPFRIVSIVSFCVREYSKC